MVAPVEVGEGGVAVSSDFANRSWFVVRGSSFSGWRVLICSRANYRLNVSL